MAGKKVHSSESKKDIKTSESVEESYFFFYGNKSPFSQHYPAKFTVNGIVFNCAEQFMMYSKAVLFKDEAKKRQIMSTEDPVKQMKCGRQIHNFEKDVWNSKAKEVVSTASIAKFDQNEELRKELFATFPCTLVEASPGDRIWGIGRAASNPKSLKKSTWRGQNKLGYILTEVRDKLMIDYE